MIEWRTTMKSKKQTIGERLRELRESKTLTQQELSEQLHVSDKTISKWEKDGSVPDTDMLITFSKFYGVTLDYLLTGNTPVVEKEAISKIELAAREDNIALLTGLNLDELDDKGKNLEFYAKKYGAEKIADYLMSAKFEEIVTTAEKCNLHHITALPKDTFDEESRTLIAWNGSFEKAPAKCAEFEKEGYHSFKVFRELGIEERFGEDYQHFDFGYLINGKNRLDFRLSTLDDKKSGLLEITLYRLKTFDLKKKDDKGKLVPDYYPESDIKMNAFGYVKPAVRSEFINLLTTLDIKNWKSQSWGCAIHNIFINLAEPENLISMDKNYIDPGKEKYQKLTKGIQRLCFETLSPYQYRQFIDIFGGGYAPYQRENVPYFAGRELFRDIELEMKEQNEGKYHRGDLLLKNKK